MSLNVNGMCACMYISALSSLNWEQRYRKCMFVLLLLIINVVGVREQGEA